VIDTSLWKKDAKSQASGTRSKFWLIEPNTCADNPTKHLFKIPTEGTGGHWAEFIASKLGERLGFHTATVELAQYNGVFGTISKNFREKTEDLFEGGDLFLSQFESFSRYSLEFYELPHIINILSTYDLEREFVNIPIFDALIANNDRHCDNWGVLTGPSGIRLAPIYDNGSSLGFNETLQRKKKMITDDRMLTGFCNRGKSSIGLPNRKKPKHFELLIFLCKQMPRQFELAIKRIESLNEDILLSIIHEIPNEIMCNLNKKWVIHLLLYRKAWILNWMEGGMKS